MKQGANSSQRQQRAAGAAVAPHSCLGERQEYPDETLHVQNTRFTSVQW